MTSISNTLVSSMVNMKSAHNMSKWNYFFNYFDKENSNLNY